MSERIVTNLIRLVFASVAGLAVGFAPVTWAQEATTNSIDLSNLVFFNGDAYAVTYEEGVSTKSTDTSVVRKIGFGKTTLVNITTTSSGVYSSDAMTSPHIRYPGVHVERLPIAGTGEAAGGEYDYRHQHIAYWTQRRGWVASPVVTAGSFVAIVPTSAGAVITTDIGTCVLTKNIAMC